MKRKTGRAAEVAAAKRDQRKADAEDDRAKRMGLDRTKTREAERNAEYNLTRTRRSGAAMPAVTKDELIAPGKMAESIGPITAPKSGLATAAKTPAKTPAKTSAKTPAKVEDKPVKIQRNYNVSPENRAAIDAAAKKTPVSKFDKAAFSDLKTGKNSYGAASIGKPAPVAAKAKAKVESGPSTKRGLNPNSIAGMIASGTFSNPFKGYRLTNDADMRAYYKKQYEERAEGKAKGGKIMKYAKGGSTTSKPPQPSAADRARSKAQLDSLKKAKPTAAEGKVAGSANRSEGPGYKKGGKMATKFGAAMKKKSADTKGRAMMKFAKGGSIDGCAIKGKTKTSMVKMARGGAAKMRGRDSYGGAMFKNGGSC